MPAVRATGSNRASIIYSSLWLRPDGAEELYVEWACNDIYRLFTGEYTVAEYYYDHVENLHAQALLEQYGAGEFCIVSRLTLSLLSSTLDMGGC